VLKAVSNAIGKNEGRLQSRPCRFTWPEIVAPSRHASVKPYMGDACGVVARAESTNAGSSTYLLGHAPRRIGEIRLAGDSASAWGTPSSRCPRPRPVKAGSSLSRQRTQSLSTRARWAVR